MELGAFSISLAVKDLERSSEFYRLLGFSEVGGDRAHHWLIMRNGDHVIGLFEGMFENNIMTFNPGWNQDGSDAQTYDDVRDIQKRLRALGVSIDSAVDETSTGPGSLMLTDPDGNQLLIDQHR